MTSVFVDALRVGNASGFYGDRLSAFREMLTGGPLDVLTGDYLAELTMLILGRDRMRDHTAGYAKTFLKQMEECLGLSLDKGVKIVVNAGGLNPAGLAEALSALAGKLGLSPRIAHVTGDDLLERADELGLGYPLTANAYLGAFGIAECLRAGADVVVTGRVTDASLVVGPAIAHFGWSPTDYDRLAGATVAGHIIECGAQATGGNYSFFTEHDVRRPGFPLAAIQPDGSSVISKHPGTGGVVTIGTVTAQLLYEIDSPRYLGPDVTTRFDSIQLSAVEEGVLVSGAVGEPPPETLKVCLNHLAGYRNEMTFILTGLDLEAKAQLVRDQLAPKAADVTWTFARTDHPDASTEEAASALLRVAVRDPDSSLVGRRFTAAAVELALAGYPGCTFTAPPAEATPYAVYTAGYVPQATVPHAAILPDGTRVAIPPPPAFALRPPTHTAPDLPGSAPAAADAGESEIAPAGNQAATTTPPTSAATTSAAAGGETRRVPLGRLVGARSGDKGGNCNIGVWARSDAAWAWLNATLTTELLRELLPETAGLTVQRHVLGNLRALNFVVEGLLGEGVSAGTRFDPQGKGVGEWLRSRTVDIPVELIDE